MSEQRPRRIQLRRTKGWRMPPNTVSVARPGPFGNSTRVRHDGLWNGGRVTLDGTPIVTEGPWLCELAHGPDTKPETVAGWWFRTKHEAMERAVAIFRLRVERLDAGQPIRERLGELRGKNLACWCPLCDAHKAGKPFGVECADCSPCHSDALGELANPANGCGGNRA